MTAEAFTAAVTTAVRRALYARLRDRIPDGEIAALSAELANKMVALTHVAQLADFAAAADTACATLGGDPLPDDPAVDTWITVREGLDPAIRAFIP